jgi:hypothetical protein
VAVPNDVALSFADNSASNYAMKNNVSLSNSTLRGDVVFNSRWNANFYANGHDSNNDGVLDTNGGWIDDGLNVDELNITLDNGSKWTGAAIFSYDAIGPAICMTLQLTAWNRRRPMTNGATLLITKPSRAACSMLR